MSIKHGLLALLSEEPMYGYQLRSRFEERTGGTWPLNVGQVYTTLGRLERDGLVAPAGDDGEGHANYRITPAGLVVVADWFGSPVTRETPPRDELAIKLAMAVTAPGVDVERVVQAQRTATLRALQEYTRLKRRTASPPTRDELAWSLVLDSLIFAAEAEVRWLDSCETRLTRVAAERTQGAPPPALAGTGTERKAAR